MESLSILFGSQERVKIMRLFLFNLEESFDVDLTSKRSKVSAKVARGELLVLEKAGLIKKKTFFQTGEKKKHGKLVEYKIKSHGFGLNPEFKYMNSLKQLLISTKTFDGDEICKRLSKSGKLKLVIVSGVFIQDPESRVDVLVVGDRINRSKLDRAMKVIEAELGKEIVYAYFEVEDYKYRIGMYDKLVRDILDYPHKVLLDKLPT